MRRRLQQLHRDEAGNGPITAVAGVLIFLSLLLLAVQTTVHLYAVSTSTAVLYDEARRVAAEGTYDCPDAEAGVVDRLGDWGTQLTPTCTPGQQVTLVIQGPSPANFLAGFGQLTGLDTFRRTVHVTTEQFQP